MTKAFTLTEKEHPMSERVRFIGIDRPPSYKVAEFLLSKGFVIATSFRKAKKHPLMYTNCEGLGILEKDAKKKPFWLPRFFMPRRKFIGEVLSNSSIQGDTDIHWVIDVFGRENVERIIELAEEMISMLNVRVTVRLKLVYPLFERYEWEAPDM
jgi:hypothetical protein